MTGQSRAGVRAGQGSEQAAVRAGDGSEQGRGQSRAGLGSGLGVIQCLSPGHSGMSMGQESGRNSGAGAGRAPNAGRVGCGCSCPRGEPRFLKVGGCSRSGYSVAGGMVDPRGHTGQGTVTPGCPGLGVGLGGRARAELVPSAPRPRGSSAQARALGFCLQLLPTDHTAS